MCGEGQTSVDKGKPVFRKTRVGRDKDTAGKLLLRQRERQTKRKKNAESSSRNCLIDNLVKVQWKELWICCHMTWTKVPAPLFTIYVTVSTRILSATSKRKLARSGKQAFTVRNRNQCSYFKQKGRNLVLAVSQEGMAELDSSCVSRNYLKVTLNN